MLPKEHAAELGPVSEPVILENVRDRLDLRPTETLPPAQGEFAHEIFALLKDRRLNTLQARTLKREFFGN